MIHIALAVYDPSGKYSRHAGVVMASVLRNTDAEVRFHILHDETLTQENAKKLREIAESSPSATSSAAHGSVNFVNVAGELDKIDRDVIDKISLRFSRGTLFRLTSPDTLPDIDKVIYLDCDTVATLDVEELWACDLHGCSLAAVPLKNVTNEKDIPLPDFTAPRDKPAADKREIRTDRYSNSKYFNAGVLVMNLSKMRAASWRDGSLLERAMEYILSRNSGLPDEEFLNAEYFGDVFFLGRKFNSDPMDENYDDLFSVKRIWHFGGHSKIWDAFSGSNADELYWHYLSLTPWSGEVIHSMLMAGTNNRYFHRHSSACMRRLRRQFIENISDAKKRLFRK